MKTRYVVESLLLGALAVLVFMPWGCGQNALGPVPAAGFEELTLPNGVVAKPGELLSGTTLIDPDAPELGPKPEIDSTDTNATNTFTETIDTTGGVITMEVQKDTAYFIVLDRALAEQVTIEITVTRDTRYATHVTTIYDCKPDGLVFEKAALLACPTDEKDGSVKFLWWWDDDKGDWDLHATAIVADGYATFPIEHFSKYATTERISLGGQQ